MAGLAIAAALYHSPKGGLKRAEVQIMRKERSTVPIGRQEIAPAQLVSCVPLSLASV